MKSAMVPMMALIMLSGCGGGSAVSVPAQFIGTWGADCASPYVQFASGTVKVFADNATYTLKSAEFQNNELSVSYDTPQGALTDIYVSEGSTLRLDRTKSGAQEATWHKAPMNKCS